MGDKFDMHTAFSRDGPNKVYVQHLLKERSKEINDLLEKKAYIYVCGDAANMAREVNTVLAQIIAEQRNIPETKAEEIVKNMRSANQYQVRDQWYPPDVKRQATFANTHVGGRLVIDNRLELAAMGNLAARVHKHFGIEESGTHSLLHYNLGRWLNMVMLCRFSNAHFMT